MGKSATDAIDPGLPVIRGVGQPVAPAERAGPTDAASAFAEVLAGVLKVEHVPADSHFFDDLGADSMVMAQFCARVRKRADLPSVSIKDVYQHPTVSRLASALAPAPAHPAEQALAEVLAGVLKVEHVPVDSHFFDDLGADSMVMAQFCARVRKRADLPSISIKDVYQHPTVAALAAAFADAEPSAKTATARAARTAPLTATPPSPVAITASTRRYVLCGALQLLMFVGYSYVAALAVARSYEWISNGPSVVDVYLRSVLVGSLGILALGTLPVVAKWVLIGRWTPREFPLWGLTYLRFWIVKTLVRWNPLALLFVGTPLYTLYLRALGAKIGRRVVIFSRAVPICADLLTIGDDTVVYKDAFLLGYRAHAGRIQTGRVTLGRNVFVGDKTILDIDTAIGDGGQLGHTSALYSGQRVPDGERWHGSPAQRTSTDYRRALPARCGTVRRLTYCVLALLQLFLLLLPLAEGGLYLLMAAVPPLAKLMDPGASAARSWELYTDALTLSLVLFGGFVVLGPIGTMTIPRLLNLFITPDKAYPLYGFHHGLHRLIGRMTNVKFFTYLFGDSVFIVHYLRGIGYKLGRIVQTGSNVGMEITHDSPYLTSLGTGTMIADGLFILNAEYSNTSFRVSQVSIGANNFLGNNIAYPSGGRTGGNCLLATKVQIPLEGPVREGVGLLGSPSFEIPRSVARDSHFDGLLTEEQHRRQLFRKTRFDLRTMGLLLFTRWLHVFLVTVLGLAAVDLYGGALEQVALGAFFALGVVISAVYYVIVERCLTRFRSLQPQYCPITDPYFWWHERYWKIPGDAYLHAFDGTPFKPLIWRLLGVRIGKRVFDDGAYFTERTLVAVGDDATFNLGSKVQCHSQEDGTFKSDRSSVGAGCTLGVGAMVHYGAAVGDGAVLAPDSFVMKGEEVPPNAWWGGNPARALGELTPVVQVRPSANQHRDPALVSAR